MLLCTELFVGFGQGHDIAHDDTLWTVFEIA
jgi:hypothetical protein